MPHRPEIFISATTKDLKTCRQLVRDALLTLGCVPVVQDHFAPDARTVKEILREKIAGCDAVVHLAGECYGFEPQERAAGEPRRSYTQLEHDIARELKKPLYTFVCAPDFPYDAHEPEPAELGVLQDAHRLALSSSDRLFLPVRNAHDLEKSVRELRFQVRSWIGRLVAVVVVSSGIVGGLLWYFDHRTMESEGQKAVLKQQNDAQGKEIDAKDKEIANLRADLNVFRTGGQLAIVRRNTPEANPREKSDPITDAQTQLATERGISVEELQKQLAKETADVRTLLVRIEKESATAQTQADQWKQLKRDAYTKLGDSEYAAGHDAAATECYQQALSLVDKQKESLVWCTFADRLMFAHWHQSHYADALLLAREIETIRTSQLGADHPATLSSVNDLAILLKANYQFDDAETLFHRCLQTRERVLGKDDPSTLHTVQTLADCLKARGKKDDLVQAESLYVRALRGQERVLGWDHPDTLRTACNLAGLLQTKGDSNSLDFAEKISRLALRAQEAKLGPDNDETLRTVWTLGQILQSKQDFAGAETQYHRALDGYKRVRGEGSEDVHYVSGLLTKLLEAKGDPASLAEAEQRYRRMIEIEEHSKGMANPYIYTLKGAAGLANSFTEKGDQVSAERLGRFVLDKRERALGNDHSDTIISAEILATSLERKDNPASRAEAQTLYHRILERDKRILGKSDPDTIRVAYKLSISLSNQGRIEEALRFARDAVDGAQSGLPEDDPRRRAPEEFLAKLQAQAAKAKQP